jgi:LysM repeat protein
VSDYENKQPTASRGQEGSTTSHLTPGRHTLVGDLHGELSSLAVGRHDAPSVQARQLQASGGHVHGAGPQAQHDVAASGISGASTDFPHRATIESLFGRPISATAHTGSAAVDATAQLGTEAYAYGNSVAFHSPSPGLHVAAHEAAHVVQQHAGIQLAGGVGTPGDPHERQADTIADRVVAGQSAADLLSRLGDGESATRSIQRYDHSVAPGETLYSIAQRYGVTVDELRAANNLQPNAVLHPGDVLHLPSFHYTVVAQDTLYAIASRFGITPAQIQAENHLADSHITPGQVLVIPMQHTVGAPAVSQASRQPAAGQPAAGQPASAPAQQAPAQQAPAQQAPAQQAPAQQAPPARGHLPGQDYTSGTVRERSFVRADNLTTIQTLNQHRVLFDTGVHVDLVRVHPTNTAWIQVRGSAFEDTRPHPTAITTPVTGWIERRWTDMTLGVFRDLEVTDRTAAFGGLAQSRLPHGDVHNIVLHQTESSSQQSTLNAYQSRIAQGGTIGAQYLIGETGEISTITGMDGRVSHVHPDLPSGANSTVNNSSSIGIEHVGMHHSIGAAPRPPRALGATATPAQREAQRAQKQAWDAEMQRVRDEIRALPLSPPFRDRLLALTDRTLFQTMQDNGWNIDVDINGRQKRSSFLLTQQLRAEYGLGQDDIYAHEEAQQKTQGEGENIRDFLVAREAYPGRVQALRALASTRPALQRSAPFMAVLQREEAMAQALAADATAPENAALAAERSTGRSGPATNREASRTHYYNEFWTHVTQLNELLQFLNGPNAANATQLQALLAAWRS